MSPHVHHLVSSLPQYQGLWGPFPPNFGALLSLARSCGDQI
jgi:hypothetical protein